MPLVDTIAKAQAALESGDLGRAKEIIRSSLRNYNHEPKLLEFYGEILLQMQDNYQAGRYFFYSVDEVSPHQKDAVKTFLNRHQLNGYRGILAASPLPYEEKLSDFSPHAQQHLQELGVPEDLGRKKNKLAGVLGTIGCLVAVLFAIGCFIIGLIAVIRWIFITI